MACRCTSFDSTDLIGDASGAAGDAQISIGDSVFEIRTIKVAHKLVQRGHVPGPGQLRRFVHRLADELDNAVAGDAFEDLVLVAGPQLLGEFRHAWSERVATRVKAEIGKDLGEFDLPQLADHLVPVLWPGREEAP